MIKTVLETDSDGIPIVVCWWVTEDEKQQRRIEFLEQKQRGEEVRKSLL